MNDYAAILVYAGFALTLFIIAMLWHQYKDFLKKKFRIINYHSDEDEQKAHHA